uniref:Odorant-bindingn protein 10 n=1 Tax=Nilaparvata lugens TaxID=108931 RepID=A0A067XN00_NILLU|nr:odorant-bindingn protein 10 [Nilaparvata lugens]
MLSESMPVIARVERDASSTTPGFPFKTNQRVALKRAKRSTIFPIDGIVERVAIFPVHEKTKRVVRESSEEDDSCKKMKPEHGAKMCCELPSVFRGSPEIFKACREELGLPDHKSPPPAPSAEGNGKPPHHGGPPHHRGKGCIAECLFNKTGLLEGGKLNKEALQKSLDEHLKTDDAWKAVATSTLDKCYDDVQTKDFKPDNEKFTSGSSEFMRCFSRGLFMDCIPSKWTDSDECSKTKETLEKCPMMLPPG